MNRTFFYKIALGMTAMIAIFFMAPLIHAAHAADITVFPAVIDSSGTPNDIMNYTLTITNTTDQQENIFATVCELTANGLQVFANPSEDDRATLLADWISVSRGAMLLMPGQSTTTPVQIQISPYADSGNYHAVVALVTGDTRDDAEHDLTGAPEALINLSVTSGLTVSLEVDNFSPDKNFYTTFPVTFDYSIENNGEATATPSGQVMLYDRTGHELGAVDANPSATAISPGVTQSFTAQWTKGGSFGQYKAVLDLSYDGSDNNLENTALVWVLPWQKLLAIFGTLFVLTIIITLWLHHEYEKRHLRRRRALENLLKKRNFETTLDLRHPHFHE
jgi:hypothetical protein